ncbi:MAG: Thioredoxin-disulfide reductase [Ilumatobacteraceae bacterium]|nr:Thioredoxin-disulfide reductase [Ilumatobacteraceae bacterium]
MADDDAFPTLSPADLATLQSFGVRSRVEVGDVLFHSGDTAYDFFVNISATVQIINDTDGVDDVVTEHGPGRFLGELSLLTGQRAYLTARVSVAGEIIAVPVAQLRRLIATVPDISDTIMAAFIARREILLNASASVIRVIGSRFSAEALALREFLVRNQLPHQWLDVDSEPDVDRLATEFGIDPADYPVALTNGAVLRRATPGSLSSYIGLTAETVPDRCVDVVVIGAGPAGLAASVYAASEGLRKLTVESVAPGGQACTSSRIENYLGFPAGISGLDLTNRALTQARKFGATLTTPCEAVALTEQAGHLVAKLSDGTMLGARAMIVATGARYRRLDVDRLADLEGAGVYYAATDTEVKLCARSPVVVVGGGNSAGQAALYLAKAGCHVTLVIRRDDLSSSMSSYLSDRIDAHPHIALRARSVISALLGDHSLEAVGIEHIDQGPTQVPAAGLFSFIGAEPATEWLADDVATDDRGFVRTDRDIDESDLGPAWRIAGRSPLPYETSRMGLFAVGDVRRGSMKRVAAAVGEGSAAVRSVHDHLAFNH